MPGLTSAPLQLAGAARFVIAANPPPRPRTLVKGPGRGGGGKGRGLRGITKVVSPAEPWAGLKWIFLKSKPKSKCSGDVRVARRVHPQVSVTVKYPPRARG